MKTLKKTSLSLLLATVAISAAPAAILYDLNTADVSGAGQNTFAASTNTAGGAGGAFTGTLPTNMVFTGGNVSFDYFVGKFDVNTLTNVGDTLTLTFTASAANFITFTGGSQAIRFGLFNIGSATDGASNTYNAATGYRADYGVDNSPGAGAIRQRTGTSSNLFATGASPSLTSNSTLFTFAPTGTFSGSLSLELLAGNQVMITSQIGGTTAVSITDTTAAFTSFNSFGFFLTGDTAASPSLNFTNLTVTAVPEPGAASLLCLGAGMTCLLRRRKAAR